MADERDRLDRILRRDAGEELAAAEQASVRVLHGPRRALPYRTPLLDVQETWATRAPALIDGPPPAFEDIQVFEVDDRDRVVRARRFLDGEVTIEVLVRHDESGATGIRFDRSGGWFAEHAFFEDVDSEGRVCRTGDLFDGTMTLGRYAYDAHGRPLVVERHRDGYPPQTWAVVWDGGSRPTAVIGPGGEVAWRRGGAGSRQRAAAEDSLTSDLLGALQVGPVSRAAVVVLRHIDDGTWTDQCLPDVRVSNAPADWEVIEWPEVDVSWSHGTLDALSELDQSGEPGDGAARSLLVRVAARLHCTLDRPTIVTAIDPPDFAADIRTGTTADERRRLPAIDV